MVLDPLHCLWDTWAWNRLLAELGGHGTELTIDVAVNLLGRHLEVVDLLQLVAHATEVLANEGLEKLVHIVTVVDIVLLEDLVAELSAGLKCKELGLSERVVAVEKDVVNLRVQIRARSGVSMPMAG